MPTTVTLQLNATDHAGDWANRSAGNARTATGPIGARTRSVHASFEDHVTLFMSELRGSIDAIKRGPSSPNLPDTRTQFAEVGFGTPIMYTGMRFAIGYA